MARSPATRAAPQWGSSTAVTHPSTWATTDYCYLEDLFVAPGVRGGGVGRALIAHVRAWAEQQGAAKVYWLTAETNTTARGLYDRLATRSGMIHYEIDLETRTEA